MSYKVHLISSQLNSLTHTCHKVPNTVEFYFKMTQTQGEVQFNKQEALQSGITSGTVKPFLS